MDRTSKKTDSHELLKLARSLEDAVRGRSSEGILEFAGPEHPEALRRIALAVAGLVEQKQSREEQLEALIEELKSLNRRIRQGALQTVAAIAGALGARDASSEGHAQRVAEYALRLGRRYGLPSDELEYVRIGGLLHDIGKIGFSDRMFRNENRTSDNGMTDEIQRHPRIGSEILQNLEFLGPALDYVRNHHERIDGAGYPRGLSGKQVPIGAQIVAVADCFDAMITDRPYRKGVKLEDAFSELRKLAGKAFSRDLVEVFIHEIQDPLLPAE